MNGSWLQARAMAKLAKHHERLAYLEHREMMIAHDELIAMSYSYTVHGKDIQVRAVALVCARSAGHDYPQSLQTQYDFC
jgi:hypothetical protein